LSSLLYGTFVAEELLSILYFIVHVSLISHNFYSLDCADATKPFFTQVAASFSNEKSGG
jgi:hypothetical protein